MIRPATPQDALFAAPLIQGTIGRIGLNLTGERSDEGAIRVIADFFERPGNRLSFENTSVLEVEGEFAGLAVAYPGAEAGKLDLPFRERLAKLGLPDQIDPETGPGEYYLDTLVVAPDFRGRGLSKLLLRAVEDRARQADCDRIGLLAEEAGAVAFQLYLRSGYQEASRRRVAGSEFAHLVKRLK